MFKKPNLYNGRGKLIRGVRYPLGSPSRPGIGQRKREYTADQSLFLRTEFLRRKCNYLDRKCDQLDKNLASTQQAHKAILEDLMAVMIYYNQDLTVEKIAEIKKELVDKGLACNATWDPELKKFVPDKL